MAFAGVIVLRTRPAYAKESRRYVRSSSFVDARLGPPVSQPAGGSFFSISLKNAKLAHATCLTCSANVRTPPNAPFVGLKLYLTAGIASANGTKDRSIIVNHCPTVAAIGSTRSCAWAE